MKPDDAPTGLLLRIIMAVTALRKYFPDANSKMLFNKVNRLVTDLVSELVRYQGTCQAVKDSKKAWKEALNSRKAIAALVAQFLKDLHAAIIPILGRDNPALLEFGFKPSKPAPKLPVEKGAEKVQKMRLTRKARHTMGSRQKEKVTGDPNAASGNGAKS